MVENTLNALKNKVDAAEVYFEEKSVNEVSFEAGALKSIEQKNLYGLSLRIINNGRIGFSSSSDPERMDEMIENALSSSLVGKETNFEFPSSTEVCAVDTFDPSIEIFSFSEAVNEGKRTVEILKEGSPKGITDIEFSTSAKTIRIANTSGLDVSYRNTDFSHSVLSVIVDGDSILWISDGGHYGTLDIRTDDYVKMISDIASKSEKKAPKVSGTMPVIFVAEEMPNLLQSIKMGINGKSLLKGDSPLIGKVGEQVLGKVTLIDNPCINNGIGSRPFDDEGVTSRSNVLFEDGIFNNFLFDLDTAGKTQHLSTANAGRNMLSMPTIKTSNFVVSEGTSSLEQMISEINEGIIVYGVLGGGQSNLIAGDFALNVMLGFLIRKGEFAGRLIDTMVSGNVYDAFKNISSMSKKVKAVGSTYVPDIMFSELTVSSR